MATYVHGHGLVSQSIDGHQHFSKYDSFHNTRSLTDMSGTVTDTYRYDAYGTLLEQTGSTTNPYLYRGEPYDAELDAYYLRARSYQPGTGRFLTTDPVEGHLADPMTWHRYVYGKNNPVNYIDPSGGITLNEALATVGILGSVSAMGWNAGNFEQFQNFYEFVADTYAPDAGILGVSVFGKLNLEQLMIDLVMPKALNIAIDSISPYLVKPYWYDLNPHQTSLGFVGGGEFMFSFGSNQMGIFVYLGGQEEIQQAKIKKPKGWDINLYTGYVFNLWNTWDYRGAFTALNFPCGSFFFDPIRLLKNEEHPWGVSWPFWSNSKSTTLGGINGTGFVRIGIGDPWEVSYAKLAFDWTLLQAAITMVLAYNYHETAAIVTGFGSGMTGLIVKSKQIYNNKHNLHTDRLTLQYRPKGWRSGPSNPLLMLRWLL